MRKTLLLVCLIAVSLCPALLRAESLTATITAYNAASLSGDVPDGLTVSFLNENHSKGQITAGKSATLTLGTWPNCTIRQASLALHSNQSSGAGTLTFYVDNTLCYTASGTLADWVGQYSTETVSLTVNGSWNVFYGQTLSLTISGTENSLYLESLTIDYTIAAPEPYCLTLTYPNEQKLVQMELCEEAVSSGVILPKVEDLSSDSLTWTFVGWSKADIASITSEPTLYPAGTTYYPSFNEQLWAVFCDDQAQEEIPQCTARTDQEVVIVMRSDEGSTMLAGAVESGYVPAQTAIVDTTEESLAYLITDHMPFNYRYRIEWQGTDSARIRHIASNSYVGWNGNKLEENSRWWLVKEGYRNSYYFYHSPTDNNYAQFLWYYLYWDDDIEDYYEVFADLTAKLNKLHEGFLLFDVTDLPYTPPVEHWSSNPFGVVHLESVTIPKASQSVAKYIYRNQIVIIRDSKIYTITGQPLGDKSIINQAE